MSAKRLGLAFIMGVIIVLVTNPFLVNDLKYDPVGTKMSLFGGVIGGTVVWYVILTIAHKAIDMVKLGRKKPDMVEEDNGRPNPRSS